MNIPKSIETALSLLNNSGFEAYIVGGAVRNYILNIPINDYDITTNAKPIEIINVFKAYPHFDYGIKHGTISVLINSELIEITTYRIESDYQDHRHPTKILFTNQLKEDLARRDFTINALCYNKKIVDYFQGINDLNNKLIRCINNPYQRFNEDALRILRAIRFKAMLNFQIESNTNNAIFASKHLLKYISIERKVNEFNKILITNNLHKTLNNYYSIFKTFISFPYIDETIDQFPPIIELRLAYILKNSNYMQILNDLKYSNEIKFKVQAIIENQNNQFNKNDLLFLKQKYESSIDLILTYHQVVNHINITPIKINLNDISVYLPKHLAIKGSDISELVPRYMISKCLYHLIYEININNLLNTKENLINYIKKCI